MGVPPGIAAAPTPARSFDASLCSEPCAPRSSSQCACGDRSQGKSLCAPGATLGMLESLPSHGTSRAPQEASQLQEEQSRRKLLPGRVVSCSSWHGPFPNFYLIFFLKQQLLESCDRC